VTGRDRSGRDGLDPEALLADRYLDDLLAAADRRADDAPADAALDPELRAAARLLRGALVRIHPSFRFEERLAERLARAAALQAAERRLERGIEPGPDDAPALTLLPAVDALDLADDRLAAYRRPLLIGGALTSAAISLVGVAWVAWRATRPASRAGRAGTGAAAALLGAAAFHEAAAGLAAELGGPA
jgi:hypothetical protein